MVTTIGIVTVSAIVCASFLACHTLVVCDGHFSAYIIISDRSVLDIHTGIIVIIVVIVLVSTYIRIITWGRKDRV
ncbi:ORF1159 [White spot syndrome virus]|uniref:ORF1159 n=1 Tax=White spot syndrome virus TaxID=342409 RepID=A0A2D3I6A2_9VIRU|nr:ORF1159 [White spot syndrome virus]